MVPLKMEEAEERAVKASPPRRGSCVLPTFRTHSCCHQPAFYTICVVPELCAKSVPSMQKLVLNNYLCGHYLPQAAV